MTWDLVIARKKCGVPLLEKALSASGIYIPRRTLVLGESCFYAYYSWATFGIDTLGTTGKDRSYI